MTEEEEKLFQKIEDPMLRRSFREKWLRNNSKCKRDLLLALTKEKQEQERVETLRRLSEKRQEMDKKVLKTPWGRHYGKLVEVY